MNFEELVTEHNGLIWLVCNKYSLKGWKKEDKYQEAITTLYEKYKEYNNDYKFSTFIYVILDNHFKNLVKREHRKIRCNYIDVDGKSIVLKDISNYDFSNTVKEQEYTEKELQVLLLSKELLKEETERNQKIIKQRLKGFTLLEVAKLHNISKERVRQIYKRYIDKIKEAK